MDIISNFLNWFSSGLLIPVIIILLGFFAGALILIGFFFGQYLSLRKTEHFMKQEIENLTPENLEAFKNKIPEKTKSLVLLYIKRILATEDPEKIEKLVSDFEIEADKNLSVSKMMTKLGPMLGLMGTLIPMGPALAGLAIGDIATMAYNMQVAFATTVIGLFISATGFVTQQFKQRWFAQDLINLDYIVEIIKKNKQSL